MVVIEADETGIFRLGGTYLLPLSLSLATQGEYYTTGLPQGYVVKDDFARVIVPFSVNDANARAFQSSYPSGALSEVITSLGEER